MTAKVRQMKDGSVELQLDGEEWRDEYTQLFVDKGCDGVLIGAPAGPSIREVSFLADLPGLRKVRFFKGVTDCSAVAELTGLTSLSLASDYKGPMSLRKLAGLRELSMPYLPAVMDISELVELRELHVWSWPKEGASFELLGNKPRLEFLRVEFKRTARVATDGFVGAPNLAKLWLYDGGLTDLDGLARLPRLIELALRSTKINSIAFVENLPELRYLELDNCGEIDSLAALRGHPKLEQVAIAGRTTIVDGDLSPLLELPVARSVAVERGAPHYNHSLADVRR